MRSGGIFDLESKQARVDDLDRQSNHTEFWTDATRAQKMLKEKGQLERTIGVWRGLAEMRDEIATLLELAVEAEDDDVANEARELIATLEQKLKALETRRLLSQEHDQMDAIVEINPGAGGTDAADWAQMLMRR